ncbi:acetyltransferase [Candidatus Bathyarchaeota archaeon]|nr:acetyltransferase [Candidatus Bathyarchaeota archaeon]
MAGSKDKLVIIGDGETAQLAYSYFTADTDYEVAGFSAEAKYMRSQRLFGLPVIPFEGVERTFNPETHWAFVAVSYTQLNRLRSRLYLTAKQKGYRLCTYISPHAYVDKDAEIGENCFILEKAAIQRGAKIGDNVTMWTGSTVGHRSKIGSNCFIAIHVAISGFCEVGENCFLGVNSCTANNIKIGADCVLGAGAVVIGDTMQGGVYAGNPAKALPDKDTAVFVSGKEIL